MKSMFTMALLYFVMTLSSARAELVGHWTFDEGAGAIAIDAINGYNGSILGGAEYTTGRLGGALHFDGIDAHVVVPHNSDLSLAGTPYTLAWWMFREEKSGNQRIVNTDNGNDYQGGYSVWYSGTASNRFRFTHMNNSGIDDGFILTTGQSTLPAGWNHMAIAFDGSDVLYYRNGQLVTFEAVLNGPITDRGLDLWFGGMPEHGQYFKGSLDDFRIYNNALSESEIIELANPVAGSGDFNADGVVDAADYAVWRKNPDSHGGDPNGYDTWRTNYGQTAAAGSGLSGAGQVPEPSTLFLLMIGLVVGNLRRRN